MKLQTASEKYPAEASQAKGTCTYMIRTVSPCCQSSGAKNSPQMRLTAVRMRPGQYSHGRTFPDSRRNWPGLAKRCSTCPVRGEAAGERASTCVSYLISRVGESIGTAIEQVTPWMTRSHCPGPGIASVWRLDERLLVGEIGTRCVFMGSAGREWCRALDRGTESYG